MTSERKTPWTPAPHKIRSAPECNKDDGDTWAYEMEVSDEHRTFVEHEANAKLWSEARAMAELLQRVADHFEGTDAPLGKDARALLARIAP